MTNTYSLAQLMSTGKYLRELKRLLRLRSFIRALLNLARTVNRFVHHRITFVSDVRRTGDSHVELIGNAEINFRNAFAVDDSMCGAQIVRIDIRGAIRIDANHLRRSGSSERRRAIQRHLQLVVVDSRDLNLSRAVR